jgi:hypothetical protein
MRTGETIVSIGKFEIKQLGYIFL